MDVDGRPLRTIWVDANDADQVLIIDQALLPFRLETVAIRSVREMVDAIATMRLRGAGCVGAAGGYGMYLATVEAARVGRVEGAAIVREAAEALKGSRPTAINLAWAVDRVAGVLDVAPVEEWQARALAEANWIADDDVDRCTRIGDHGLPLLREVHERTGSTVNILTHCNAGWLAFVDRGTATAPIYAAHAAGIPIHVWVDETRPRHQGSRLTAWELGKAGVPYTVIVDNAGGHLMQHGMVDLVLVGTDRTSASGDVANKIGTYLKALAAADNGVPFYAAVPSSSVDWESRDGVTDTPIERRDGREVTHVAGLLGDEVAEVQVVPTGAGSVNFGFDVTPARLVTGLVTERGVCAASEAGLLGLFPEHRPTEAT